MTGLRIGDAERDEAAARLGEHYVAGRLSAQERDDRVDAAMRARTQEDLTPLFQDLPGIAAAGPEAGSRAGDLTGAGASSDGAARRRGGPALPFGPRLLWWAPVPFVILPLLVAGAVAAIGITLHVLPLVLMLWFALTVLRRVGGARASTGHRGCSGPQPPWSRQHRPTLGR